MPEKPHKKQSPEHMIDKIKIGVMGSASGPTLENIEYLKEAFELGRQIALQGCILINGACPGLPDEAAKGAQEEGGFVFGVSPAYSKFEHEQEYRSPINHDFVLFTGMGFMERDIINIRSADAIVIVGGGIGSLNEFTIAYDEERPIGVLTNTGGISDDIEEILKMCDRKMKDWIILESDPKILVEKLIKICEDYSYPKYEDSRVKDRNRKGPKRRG